MTELTKEQKEELERFGANTWFVEYLYKQYQENPTAVPEQWKSFFGNVDHSKNGNGKKNYQASSITSAANIEFPKPGENDETQIIAGSSARILKI
jgi:2-oxoglutarate dehydrogenase complex dehydrogenase (E1) component-like enzyme